MKKLLLAAGLAATIASIAAANDGIAYGQDGALNFPSYSEAAFNFWLSNANGALQFQNFIYEDVTVPGDTLTVFTGDSLVSLTTYTDPFFGKVADATINGVISGEFVALGRRAIAHFRVTQSAYPGSTFGYCTIDITLPGWSTPIFSRIGLTGNRSHILVGPNATPNGQSPTLSGHGVASGNVLGSTNRGESVVCKYWVADNYLQQFDYLDVNGSFHADRLRSFGCTNNGIFGKQAEFWLDGRTNTGGASSGRTTVAHVIVTKSNSPALILYNLMYIAEYLPNNLNTPIYERLVLIEDGTSRHSLQVIQERAIK